MVAGENQNVVGVVELNKAHILINSIGSAFVPGPFFSLAHIGREDVNAAVGSIQIPWLAIADVAVELQRAVLRQYADCVNARVDTVGQGEIDNPVLSAERDGGLCYMAGERMETGPLPSRQQHGYDFFFHLMNTSLDWI